MKKNLKICLEQTPSDEARCLLDVNQYARLETCGFALDLAHKKTAHVSAAWRFASHSRITLPMDHADLTAYRYLTFSVFASCGAGGSFSLLFDSSEQGDGSSGYEYTFSIAHDGWNDYRIELPFLRAWRAPIGWDCINGMVFDCVIGGQSNREETVLSFDSLYVWREMAPPLYTTMPELKGAAAFAAGGTFAIVNRKRLTLSIDGTDVRPFEQNGEWWVPMGAIAAVMAHSAVADNKSCTLSFTYRRRKYLFEEKSAMMQVDGIRQSIPVSPVAREGILFFPAEFVREFFRWRYVYTNAMGLIVFSNRKTLFDPLRDAGRVRQLVADLTFKRPTGEMLVEDLHKKIKNPTRGRLLATFDELMALRKLAKTDETLKSRLNALRAAWADAEVTCFTGGEALEAELKASSEKMIAWSMLYRLTGDKSYCELAAKEAEAASALSDWRADEPAVLATMALGVSIAYDWCHHVWSEARKAIIERAMLRMVLRPAAEAYRGRGKMWDAGAAIAAQINAGFLATALTLADVYPETTLKILRHVLRNAETMMEAFAPDGGFAEGVGAWEIGVRGACLLSQMLTTACGEDYGFSAMPGFAASADFAIHTETANGAWNYHNCRAERVDTSMLSYFTRLTGKEIYAWLRLRELTMGKKVVTPWDLLFYTPVDAAASFELPLDAVYRRAGLAVMRADWDNDGMIVGLHGGRNNERDGDLDAGSFFLECAGERFFGETGGTDAISMLMRRRAEGQNTIVINPTEEHLPDQNPGAWAPIVEMKCAEACAYAMVDLSATNEAFVRAKRGVLLTEHRRIAVIQDEAVLRAAGVVVWHAYTQAEVALNKSGRIAKLTLNGKTLICRLVGVGSPARFAAEAVGESGWTHLTVCVEGKDRLRMAVVCYLERAGEALSAFRYEMKPMSKWGE